MYVPKCAACNDRKFSEFGGIRKLCALCKDIEAPAAVIYAEPTERASSFNVDLPSAEVVKKQRGRPKNVV